MDSDKAQRLILRYIDLYLFEPLLSWPKQEFESRSIGRFVASAILTAILDHPNKDIDELMFDFYLSLKYFESTIADDNPMYWRIDIAKDIVCDISSYLHTEGEQT